MTHFIPIPLLLFALLHFIAWFTIDAAVFKIVRNHIPGGPGKAPHEDLGWEFLLAWIERELLALPIWILAMISNDFSWRDSGVVYGIKGNGIIEIKRPHEP